MRRSLFVMSADFPQSILSVAARVLRLRPALNIFSPASTPGSNFMPVEVFLCCTSLHEMFCACVGWLGLLTAPGVPTAAGQDDPPFLGDLSPLVFLQVRLLRSHNRSLRGKTLPFVSERFHHMSQVCVHPQTHVALTFDLYLTALGDPPTSRQ